MDRIVFKRENAIKAVAWLSSFIAKMSDKEYVLEAKEYRKRRSLDANAYCWVLIDRLAEKLSIPKTDIYKRAIKEIGGNSETVCVRQEAAEALISGWGHNGLGWFAETAKSKLKGCINVVLYYGSSVYDTRQMSNLIDYIVQDCKAVGIETKTDRELSLLKEEWGI